jgi:hypothetical protein
MNAITCKHIGVSGAKIHWMKSKDGKLFWCRQAIAIMGSFNMPMEYIERVSPFEPDFRDNFIEGKGKTKEEALNQMRKGAQEISDSLWII